MAQDTPDGIMAEAVTPRSRRANPSPLLLLSALLVAGFAGLLGGHQPDSRAIENENVLLAVTTPETLRSGMVFETVVDLTAKRPVKKLTIGLSDSLWREMTINTMIPAADSEEYANGSHRFVFAELNAGESFRFKIDGQINPPLLGMARGEIAVFDGEQRLADISLHTKVLP